MLVYFIDQLEPANKLQFERGTISYVLLATFTRPTTISPTFNCEKKVYFIEAIDVAQSRTPKPRTITLRPLTKRNKSKSHVPRATREDAASTPTNTDASRRPSGTDSPTNQAADETPASPSVSEFSTGSGPSSNMSFQIAQTTSRVTLNADGLPSKNNDKTITAFVSLLEGGCLPGDLIPLHITVYHTRAITSMQGIIVTLYRKARIDSHPIMFETAKEMLLDDVPRSRTGLGGLSLSAPSSHIFRMDLAQSFAPMVVNPVTLEAEIKTEVRAPEDLFPTISCISGDMITFTYHVEVVMDLAGKFADHDRFPRMHMISNPGFSFGSKPSSLGYGMHSSTETYHLIDTSEIRREKSVAECTFEITIGTKDSRRDNATLRIPSTLGQELTQVNDVDAPSSGPRNEERSIPLADAQRPDLSQAVHPSLVPPPELEEPADEKVRLRLAEQRLLPSAPPQDDDDASSSQLQASAPTLDAIGEAYGESSQNRAYRELGFSSDSLDDGHGDESVPVYQRHEADTMPSLGVARRTDSAETSAPTEDKQELERRRLFAMASSPDDHQEEEDGEDTGGHNRPDLPVPTAPVFDEDDEFVDHSSPTHAPASSSTMAEHEREDEDEAEPERQA